MSNQFDYISETERQEQDKIQSDMSIKEVFDSIKNDQLTQTPNRNGNNDQQEKYLEYINKLLLLMGKEDASDMFITVGFPPAFKVHGSLQPIAGTSALTPEQSLNLVLSTMTEKQKKEFLATNECNYAISFSTVGRFRVNAFRQRGSAGMVLRVINTTIPQLDDLSVPEKLKSIIMEKRGLVIVVGATGSGKSTTLAAMIGYRNKNQAGHIITIEDPIEFVHQHQKSIVMQREVGIDTENWDIALKNTLRQAPDVILIGEIRDRETMEHAIAFAETGHLCLATLHANNSNQALDRIINFFPEERRHQLLMDLSLNLKGVISQRLIPSTTGKRVPAVEILLNSARIADLILKGDIGTIKESMKTSRETGMQTFDQALFDLYEADLISLADALRNADSMNDLQLEIKLKSKHSVPEKLVEELKIQGM
jgi:twitching motility protein PilU